MKIERVAEHSFCPELLKPNANVLDLGCLGFLFANEMTRLGYNVHCVDIQELDGLYDRGAITDYDGIGYVVPSSDKQAFCFSRTRTPDSIEIECLTLVSYMRSKSVKLYDLIKMDVESSEREIILSLVDPPARQISCEFHCHTGAYSVSYVDILVSKLESIGYTVLQHKLERRYGCSENYWDSLFYLK